MERGKKKSLLTSISNPENRRFNYYNCLNEYRFREYPAADSATLILPGSTKKGVKQEDLETLCLVRITMTIPSLVSLSHSFVLYELQQEKAPLLDGLWSKPSGQKMGKEGERER